MVFCNKKICDMSMDFHVNIGENVNCIVTTRMIYFNMYVKGCLLKMKNIFKNFFVNHMYAMMIVLIFALMMKLIIDTNIILAFVILFFAYLILTFAAEFVLSIIEDKRSAKKGNKAEKTTQSVNKPAEKKIEKSASSSTLRYSSREHTANNRPSEKSDVAPQEPSSRISYNTQPRKTSSIYGNNKATDNKEENRKSYTGSYTKTYTSSYTSKSIPDFDDKNTPPKGTPATSQATRQYSVPVAPPVGYDEKTAENIQNIYNKNKARNMSEKNIKEEQEQKVAPVKTAEETGIYKDVESATPDDIDEYSVNLSLEIDKRISESRDSRPARRRRVFGEVPSDNVASATPAPQRSTTPVKQVSASEVPQSQVPDFDPAPIDDDVAPIEKSDIAQEFRPASVFGSPSEPTRSQASVPTPATTRFVRRRYDDQVKANPANLDKLFGPSNNNASDDVSKKKITKKSQKYIKPDVELLQQARLGKGVDVEALEQEQNHRAKRLIDTLSSFGVGAKIVGIMRGPAVTRYEIQPNPGVKVSKIVSLSDDIALNLAAAGVRMEAPIPGKEAVGIEVPNKTIEMVYLRDVIDSSEFKELKSNLSFAIGKDIAGKNIVADIGKMPHLLIAGATGSGKSVCINTIIASLLYKSGPNDVKLILVDPKIVELGVYNGIPHLLVPVVTDPRKAAGALAWAVGEMEARYTAFSQHGVRDLNSYNELAKKDRSIQHMPQIVIVIDELADLMMTAAKEIEDSIIRLAQKARAAGVHLIIATQRPSVDVITGLIKANIPSRIAFAVTSQVDSRTILDGGGAEKLLGRGDMLFHPIGRQKPLRVQGAFVSDGEIERLVSFVKESWGTVTYDESIEQSIEQEANRRKGAGAGHGGNSDSSDDDMDTDVDSDSDLIEQAAQIAFEYNQISASFLQRKLRLGYSRASRIIDTLEERGLISSADGSKPRRIIMTEDQWRQSQD